MSRLVVAAVIAAFALAPLGLNDFRVVLLAEIAVFALAAASLNLLAGRAGLPSLGHALFFGVGGYGAGWLGVHVTDNAFAGILFAVVLAVVVALPTGWIAVRTEGIYFVMLTLAFAELARSLSVSLQSVTGGSDGLTGIPSPTVLGSTLELSSTMARYYFGVLISGVGYALLRYLSRTPFGATLSGVRENEERMRSLGYDTTRYKLTGYTIAGAAGAIAGALYVQLIRFASPSSLAFEVSALIFVMVLLGGVRTRWGPLIGAAIVVFGRQELSSQFGAWHFGMGIVLVLVIYLLPRGIAGTNWRILRGADKQAGVAS